MNGEAIEAALVGVFDLTKVGQKPGRPATRSTGQHRQGDDQTATRRYAGRRRDRTVGAVPARRLAVFGSMLLIAMTAFSAAVDTRFGDSALPATLLRFGGTGDGTIVRVIRKRLTSRRLWRQPGGRADCLDRRAPNRCRPRHPATPLKSRRTRRHRHADHRRRALTGLARRPCRAEPMRFSIGPTISP